MFLLVEFGQLGYGSGIIVKVRFGMSGIRIDGPGRESVTLEEDS